MATVFLAPVFVQIQQQIQPTVEAIHGVFVEVGVYAEFAASNDLMKPATLESRIGYQIIDARNLTQEL